MVWSMSVGETMTSVLCGGGLHLSTSHLTQPEPFCHRNLQNVAYISAEKVLTLS